MTPIGSLILVGLGFVGLVLVVVWPDLKRKLPFLAFFKRTDHENELRAATELRLQNIESLIGDLSESRAEIAPRQEGVDILLKEFMRRVEALEKALETQNRKMFGQGE